MKRLLLFSLSFIVFFFIFNFLVSSSNVVYAQEESLSCNIGEVCDNTPYGGPNYCCGDTVCNDTSNFRWNENCECLDRFTAEAGVPHPEYTLPGCGAPEPTETPVPTEVPCAQSDQYNECCAPGKSRNVKKFTTPDGEVCKWDIGNCDQNDTVCQSACTSNGSCTAGEPSCGQVTQGEDNCKNACYKRGGACSSTPGQPTSTPPPRPTSAPTPTPTAAVSPTPVQASQIVSSFPTPTRAANTSSGSSVPQDQRWVCLQASPCSNSASQCSGNSVKDIGHRVKLTSKTDVKPLAGITYIIECLQTSQGPRCTTGNSNLDRQVLGTDNYSSYQSLYGYGFLGFFNQDGRTSVPNPIQTPSSGNIGIFEWESQTRDTLGHIFLAMNPFSGSNIVAGDQGGQQQTGLDFSVANKNCIMIKWDPQGQVFDSQTLKPLANVEITLFRKNSDDQFMVVNNNDVLGGIINPVKTSQDGSYNFFVPEGVYKIKAQTPNYDIYTSNEFIQKVGDAPHDIQLNPSSNKILKDLRVFLKKIQNLINNSL